ncbi:hypothetical protein IFM89_016276, partial [Coptis chinensis]
RVGSINLFKRDVNITLRRQFGLKVSVGVFLRNIDGGVKMDEDRIDLDLLLESYANQFPFRGEKKFRAMMNLRQEQELEFTSHIRILQRPCALYKYKKLFKLFHLHNGENGNGNKFYKTIFAADELKRDILHELPLIFSAGLKLGSSVFIVSKLCGHSVCIYIVLSKTVDNSGTVIGIKCKDGIVMAVAGLAADGKQIVARTKSEATNYERSASLLDA